MKKKSYHTDYYSTRPAHICHYNSISDGRSILLSYTQTIKSPQPEGIVKNGKAFLGQVLTITMNTECPVPGKLTAEAKPPSLLQMQVDKPCTHWQGFDKTDALPSGAPGIHSSSILVQGKPHNTEQDTQPVLHRAKE